MRLKGTEVKQKGKEAEEDFAVAGVGLVKGQPCVLQSRRITIIVTTSRVS